MRNEVNTENNERKQDYMARMLKQIYKENLIQGFYGQIGFIIKVQDGSIQKVEKHVQQDFIK